nr:unnamed protein product [Digitaria exilis]
MAKASAPEDRIDFDLATEMHDDLYRKRVIHHTSHVKWKAELSSLGGAPICMTSHRGGLWSMSDLEKQRRH